MALTPTRSACFSCCKTRKHLRRLSTGLRRKFTSSASSDAEVPKHDLPLSGIRVLDLTRILAGPYCSMILGDLGADVIKVERPGTGDDTRTWGPPFCGDQSAYFLSINRNKKSVAVNFKAREGNQIVKELIKKSDVLLENYIPGKLGEMGLSYQDTQKDNPSLIYCSITGYGQTGPYAQRAGYDVIAAGLGGLMHITGPSDGEPCRVGVAMTDLSTGLYAYGAIMASLLYRNKTGQGQYIDCNLLNTQVATLTHIASNYLNAGQEAKRHGTGHESIVPYQAFKTSDGYLTVGAGNNGHFETLCKRIGMEDLSKNPNYSSNQKRVTHRKELIESLSQRFSQKSTSEWLAILEGCGIPYGPINNMERVFADTQVKHSGIVQEMQHPTAGLTRVVGPAVQYSEFDLPLQRPPPTLGQHTGEVLENLLGYTPQEIQGLADKGVVGI